MKTGRRQPTIAGIVREKSSEALDPLIATELRRLARQFEVSVSWVKTTILADALKIRRQPRYYIEAVKAKKRRAG